MPAVCGAGQAIVQFATSIQDEGNYALKFFLEPEAYEAEASKYRDSNLTQLLPRLEACIQNEDGLLVDPAGEKFPPCIITERGERLDEWCRRNQPDMWTSMLVRFHSIIISSLTCIA
jgi:hypothetical protein